MQMRRMYPLPQSSAGAWWADNGKEQFLLLRCNQGWQLSCLTRGMSLLVKHGLLQQSFATRREAIQCLEGMLISQAGQLRQD